MNWYRKAQAAELVEPKNDNYIDLSEITPKQWKEINDRMVAIGYDFRGWEDTKRAFERIQVRRGGIFDDHEKVLNAVLGGQEYAKKPDPKQSKNAFQRAIRYFGITNDIKECGYILPNGLMLNLSEKGQVGGRRGVDHREVSSINVSMDDFISMGAIRHGPEMPFVDIRKKPTYPLPDFTDTQYITRISASVG